MEKPKHIYIAQTSIGVLSVVNEHYPGATEYVRKEGEAPGDREVMKSYLLDVLRGGNPEEVSRGELIAFVKAL